MPNRTAKAPMTIKAVPVEVRQTMLRCANARGESMAEWLTRAVSAQAAVEANDAVYPPGNPVVPAGQTDPAPVDLTGTATAMDALARMAAAGLDVPKSTTRQACALLRQQMRQARGLPPLTSRRGGKTIGQTVPAIGQTIIDGEGGDA